jgi:thiopeptide-type bacteriocin biosynthesis protein
MAEAAIHRMIRDCRDQPTDPGEIESAELGDWYRIYREAGRAALCEYLRRRWVSLRLVLRSEDRSVDALERVKQSLNGGEIQWWFLRKVDEEGPHLRLRVRRTPPLGESLVPTALETVLQELQADAVVTQWNSTFYEPETTLFGGAEGMAASHAFFCADSLAIVGLLTLDQGGIAESPVLRRHLYPALSSLILTSALQGARLDAFETWDVWRRILVYRPFPLTPAMVEAVTRTRYALKTAVHDTANDDVVGSCIDQFKGSLEVWRTMAWELGNDLRLIAKRGRLERGLREVLTVHALFHWNRIGFGPGVQSCIARAAVLNCEPS